MSAVPTQVTGAPADGHASDLASLGYKQELSRELGPFASFASGFSFVSILTTVFQLFALGFALGGPAYFWTWPIVFVGQFSVSLCFAELSAQYPIAGAVYQWSRRVSTDPIGWVAGWLMMIGYIISIAAIAIALQAVLPPIWSGFQVIGHDQSPLSPDGAKNAILIGTVCIALCAVIGSLGVSKMSLLTRIGVTCEIIGVVIVLILLFAHATRGPGVVFHTEGVAGKGSYIGPFFASMLMAAYVMYGFDSAAELSEETSDPKRTAPRAILLCMLVSAVGGGLMIIAALMAAPNLKSPDLSLGGIPYILEQVLPEGLAKFVLVVVAISIFSAALAISASATRVVFSMARDGRLPFAKQLSYVSPRTQTPYMAALTVSVLAIAVLLFNLGQTGVFASVTSISVVIVYMAYLFVTVPLLIKRIQAGRLFAEPIDGPGYFTLGRLGLPINIIAVVFGAVLMVNVGWPRKEIYDPAGGHWLLQYSAPIFVIVALALGGLAYMVMRNQQSSSAGVITADEPTQVTSAV
jgi:urea carboxylase system permease